MNAWYCPGAFNLASRTWQDCSSNGNTATLSGSGLAELRGAGHGASREVLALSGTTSSVIAFGPVIKSSFTLCSVTRYTGGAKERILQGQGGKANFFHGHYSGEVGVAAYDGFKTRSRGSVSPDTDWLVMCGTNDGSQLKLANGVDVGTAGGGRGDVSLIVNAGDFYAEKSDFAIAEVIAWPRGLSAEEMNRVSEHLIERLHMPQPRSPPMAPPPPSPPPPTPSPLPPPVGVSLVLVAAGSVDDFGQSRQTELRTRVATAAGVAVEKITLSIEAASVFLRFSILVEAAASTTAAASLAAALPSAAAASALLGVVVEEAPLLTLAGQSAPLPEAHLDPTRPTLEESASHVETAGGGEDSNLALPLTGAGALLLAALLVVVAAVLFRRAKR